MTRLNWTDTDRYYESGVDQGVYYPQEGFAEVWNGLVSVNESPSDSESRPRYLDGRQIGARQTAGGFSGTIEAFTYPEAFFIDVLSQRVRKKFGLSYRVNTNEGTKIHLVYNVSVTPTQMNYRYFEADPFSWGFNTTPIAIPNGRPSAHLILDTARAYPSAIADFDRLLYGDDRAEARLPSPAEVFQLFEDNAVLIVTDHGDGTCTVTGPDSAIQMLDATTVQLDWPSVSYLDAETFTIRSY